MKLLSIAAVFALAACSSSAKKPPPAPGGDAEGDGRAHAFKIGGLEAAALQDGELTMPNDGKVLGMGHVEETGDLLAANGLSRDEFQLSIQPLLVKAGGRVLLFDTGAGGAYPNTGWMRSSLTKAGVAPADVTDIFISHGHPDHTGGLVADGALVYPNAVIHVSAPEWADIQAQAANQALVDAITAKVVAFEPGAELLPEVRAVATQGHTPGHSSYVIGAGDDRLFYLGDLAHHHVVSVQKPEWSIQFDGPQPTAAEAMRAQILSTLSADGSRVYAVHFPFPGLGRFADQNGTVVWQAE